jgi:hypothetical protein
MKNKLSTSAVAALISLAALSANADQVISANTSSTFNASGGDIIISGGVTMDSTSGNALRVDGVNVNNLTNNGSVFQSRAGTAINFNSLNSSATIINNGQIGRYNGSNSTNTGPGIILDSKASVINNGFIDGTGQGLITVNSGASGSSITNNGGIGTNYQAFFGIKVAASTTLSDLTNASEKSIKGLYAVANNGTITNLTNYGLISGYHWVNAPALADGTIVNLTNYGSILASMSGTAITSSVTNLANAQGAKTGVALSIANLATNYNVIVNSSNDFGKLSVQNASGSMAFGINNGSTIAADTTYSNVLTGLNGTSAGSSITGTGFTVTGATGVLNGLNYSLIANSITSGGWDLVVGSSVNPVPEADTSAMLLMGAGVMGFMARRRKNTQA